MKHPALPSSATPRPSLWARIGGTSRPALLFVVLALVHGLVQSTLQAGVFNAARHQGHVFREIVKAPSQGNVQRVSMPSSAATSAVVYATAVASSDSGHLAALKTIWRVSTDYVTATATVTVPSSTATLSLTTDTKPAPTVMAARIKGVEGLGKDRDRDGDGDQDDQKGGGKSKDVAHLAHRFARRAGHHTRRAAVQDDRFDDGDGKEDGNGDDDLSRGLSSDDFGGNSTRFIVPGVKDDKGDILLVTSQCALVLEDWPKDFVDHLSTSSVAFLVFHIWLAMLSLSAVYYESIAHLGAVVISHVLGTIYAIYQITQTNFFQNLFFNQVIQQACQDSRLVAIFWGQAKTFEIALVVLEALAVLEASYLSYLLFSIFSWSTYKTLGANRQISRVHTLSLILTVFLHLLLFFNTAFLSIWLRELIRFDRKEFVQLAGSTMLGRGYKVFLGLVTVMGVGMVGLASWALGRSSRVGLVLFLGFDFILLVHNIVLLTQPIFKSTKSNWLFLSFMSIVSLIITFSTFLLGLVVLHHLIRNHSTESHLFRSDKEEEGKGEKSDYWPTTFITSVPSSFSHSSSILPSAGLERGIEIDGGRERELVGILAPIDPHKLEPARKLKINFSSKSLPTHVAPSHSSLRLEQYQRKGMEEEEKGYYGASNHSSFHESILGREEEQEKGRIESMVFPRFVIEGFGEEVEVREHLEGKQEEKEGGGISRSSSIATSISTSSPSSSSIRITLPPHPSAKLSPPQLRHSGKEGGTTKLPARLEISRWSMSTRFTRESSSGSGTNTTAFAVPDSSPV